MLSSIIGNSMFVSWYRGITDFLLLNIILIVLTKECVACRFRTYCFMCSNPQTIPNPNFGCQDKGLGFMKDCVSKFINVPCGHCPECIANRQMQIVQRVQMEELENHIFFASLTYNNDMLPRLSCSNGRDIRFADKKDVQSMMKRLRKSGVFGRPFRYLAVSELGALKGRPH